MKLRSNGFLRFLPFPGVTLAAAVLVSPAHAADLIHNATSTLTLTGVVSYGNVKVGSAAGTSNATKATAPKSAVLPAGSLFSAPMPR